MFLVAHQVTYKYKIEELLEGGTPVALKVSPHFLPRFLKQCHLLTSFTTNNTLEI